MTIEKIPAITTLYLYVLFTVTLYFIFSENNDIINMHTILLTKYEMRIQRRSLNIYI